MEEPSDAGRRPLLNFAYLRRALRRGRRRAGHGRHGPPKLEAIDDDIRLRELELWISHYKRVLDTQQDFNDLIMRTRTAGLALIQAVFGFAAFSLTRDSFVELGGHHVHVSAFVILFGLGMILNLYQIDHNYYFRMLVHSVRFGAELEESAPLFFQTMVSGRFGITRVITAGAEASGPDSRRSEKTSSQEELKKPKELKEIPAGTQRSRFSVRLFYGVPALLGVAFLVVVLVAVRPDGL